MGRGSCGAGSGRGTFVPWSRGLGGQGGVCQLQPPTSSRCSGDSGISLRSNVAVPHGHSHGPAGAPCRARVSLPAWQHRCLHPAFRQLPLPGEGGDGGTQPDQPPQGAGVQDLAFLTLGSGVISQSGWAVTACFPSDVRQPLAGSRSSGTLLHSYAQLGHHHGLRAATRYAQESATIHHAGTWWPRIPQPALLPTHPLCAPSLLGTPWGSP